MKSAKIRAILFLSVIVGFIMTGCGTHRNEITPFGNGYEGAAYYRGLVHVTVRYELQYRYPNGKLQVISGGLMDQAIKDDTIVFLGRLWTDEPSIRGTHLFAYQPSGPVIDITRQMFALEAKRRSDQVPELHSYANTVKLRKSSDGVVVGITYEKWGAPDVKLSWGQISDMMKEAKANGLMHTNLIRNMPYLEKEMSLK